jgi:hypothetical protein
MKKINCPGSIFLTLPLILTIMIGCLFITVQAQAKMLWGEPNALGKGTARTFVVMNDQGKPVSLGIAFDRKALSGLPAEAVPPEVMLKLPAKADVRHFKYVVINWNPQGHEPKMYQVPHFDYHFYMMPNEEREKITGNDARQFARLPDPKYLPGDYMLAPGGVPRMGAHNVDKTSPELQGKAFTTTFIFGTYDGKVTFLEPMVSMHFLKTMPDFSAPVKQPAAFEQSGFFPAAYSVKYDKKRGEYRISLDDLTFH